MRNGFRINKRIFLCLIYNILQLETRARFMYGACNLDSVASAFLCPTQAPLILLTLYWFFFSWKHSTIFLCYSFFTFACIRIDQCTNKMANIKWMNVARNERFSFRSFSNRIGHVRIEREKNSINSK